MMPTGEPNVARSASLFLCYVLRLVDSFIGVRCVVRRSRDGMDEVVVSLESKPVLYSVSDSECMRGNQSTVVDWS